MSIGEKLKLVFSGVKDYLMPFIRIFLSQAGSILASSAMAAVKTVADTMGDSDGDAKRKAAFNMILDDLRAKSIAISVSAINAAIEAAYQKYKAE